MANFSSLINKADSYAVPSSVRAAAKRGLELRKKQPKSGKAGLDTREAAKQGIGSGVARARDLMSGRVSKETIKRMHAYFSRHQGNYKLDSGKKPHEDKGYVAGLLWGGEAGRSFAARMVKKFEREESTKKKKNFDDISNRYAAASGRKVREVSRVSIRYSLDKMANSGKIKTINRGGEMFYADGRNGDKDGSDS